MNAIRKETVSAARSFKGGLDPSSRDWSGFYFTNDELRALHRSLTDRLPKVGAKLTAAAVAEVQATKDALRNVEQELAVQHRRYPHMYGLRYHHGWVPSSWLASHLFDVVTERAERFPQELHHWKHGYGITGRVLMTQRVDQAHQTETIVCKRCRAYCVDYIATSVMLAPFSSSIQGIDLCRTCAALEVLL